MEYINILKSGDSSYNAMSEEELRSKLKLRYMHLYSYTNTVLYAEISMDPGKHIGGHMHFKEITISLDGTIKCHSSSWDG
jgi:hypothetical protein